MKLVEMIKGLFRPRYAWRHEETGQWLSEKEARNNPKAMRTRILFPRGGHHK